MEKRDIVNDKKTLKIYTKDDLIERVILLQEYIIELKDNNKELLKKIEKNSMLFSELDKLQNLEPLVKEIYPILIKAIQIFEGNNTFKRTPKGYGLVKIPNKKHGFLYYVRYYENGRMIPTKWNTYTNVLDVAKEFAEKNRIKILDEYHKKQSMNDTNVKDYRNMFGILKSFYSENSIFLNYYKKLNITISDDVRIYNNNIINKIFIPFLKKNNVKTFNEITAPTIGNFQLYLIDKNKTPHCIRRYIRALEYVFSNLVMMGIIETNVFERIPKIKKQNK
jgi:hypothetical protein